MLDMHCLDTSGTDASPVFYNSKYSVEDAISGWTAMAERYKDAWNVMGIDVFNEPSDGTWAEGLDTDMDAFAVSVATAVHETTDWLIFVEGTSKSPTCDGIIDGDEVVCGYGDNLKGVGSAPVVLAKEKKVVYTPHTYGPSQHDRAEFTNAAYPDNMPDVWQDHWGYIRNISSAAVVLGEWGGPVAPEDEQNGLWMDKLVAYLTENKMTSNFYWCLNSDSTPTGLIIDWETPDEGKLALLDTLTPSPTNVTELHQKYTAHHQASIY